MPGFLGGLGAIARSTPQGLILNGLRNVIGGRPFLQGSIFGPRDQAAFSGDPNDPNSGLSSPWASASPTRYTPNPSAPAATATPAAPADTGGSPLAGPGGSQGYNSPGDYAQPDAGPFSGLPFQQGAGSMWGSGSPSSQQTSIFNPTIEGSSQLPGIWGTMSNIVGGIGNAITGNGVQNYGFGHGDTGPTADSNFDSGGNYVGGNSGGEESSGESPGSGFSAYGNGSSYMLGGPAGGYNTANRPL